jgi:hypothetical protein
MSLSHHACADRCHTAEIVEEGVVRELLGHVGNPLAHHKFLWLEIAR